MRKGFTLIELLAVIVILAIIALIATPIVLNIIDDAKENANKRSIDNFAHALELEIARDEMKNDFSTLDNIIENVEYDGSRVECNIRKIKSDGQVYLEDCSVDGNVIENYSYGKRSHETTPMISLHTGNNKITGYTLNKTGDYGLDIYSNATLDSYITYTIGGDSYTQRAISDKSGNIYYPVSIAPKYVSDNITITLYVNNASVDSVIVSVKSYCESVLADNNNSDSFDFIVATVLYGSKTQTAFGYNTSNLAENILNTTVDLSSIEISGGVLQDDSTIGIRLSGSSVSHDSRLGHNLYLTLNSGENINNYKFMVGSTSYEATQSSGQYKISVPINNLNIYDNQVLIIKKGTETKQISVSVLYAIALYNNYGGIYSDLEKSLVYYSEKGNEYYY